MNWVSRFFGTKDKEQLARTQEVLETSRVKKNRASSNFKKLHQQAKKIHSHALRITRESSELVSIVADITAQIAKATGNGRKKK